MYIKFKNFVRCSSIPIKVDILLHIDFISMSDLFKMYSTLKIFCML